MQTYKRCIYPVDFYRSSSNNHSRRTAHLSCYSLSVLDTPSHPPQSHATNEEWRGQLTSCLENVPLKVTAKATVVHACQVFGRGMGLNVILKTPERPQSGDLSQLSSQLKSTANCMAARHSPELPVTRLNYLLTI